MTTNCTHCNMIPDSVEKQIEIETYKKKLTSIKGSGQYYRGESMQLTKYRLLQCTKCKQYFEDGHHFYSDPESTMGLGRDEDEWFRLTRLSPELAKVRLEKIK